MMPPAYAVNELERLAALDRYAILDTSPEEAFEEIVKLASTVCVTPIALISLVDETRQWFKARIGLAAVETSRDISFCAHAVLQQKMFIVPDTLADPRFVDNPLVTADPEIRFYAGAPLTTPDGFNLGTLCVIDRKPRVLTEEQCGALRALARQVMVQLELRRLVAERDTANANLVAERDELQRMKRDFISTVNHELRTPLTSIRGSLTLLASGVMGELPEAARPMISVAERNSVRLISVVNDILDFDKLESLRVLERSIENVRALAVRDGVRLELRGADALVLVDEAPMAQVVVNLLSTAVKDSHRGGTVQVTATSLDGWVELQIEDSGTFWFRSRGVAGAAVEGASA